MSEAAIYAALQIENQRCDPPKSDEDLQRITKSIMRYEPENPVITQEVSVEPGAQVESPTVEAGMNPGGVGEDSPGDGQLILTNPSRPLLPALFSFSDLQQVEIPDIEVVPTPLNFLNKYLFGGFGLGELAFLVAKQESGKTSLSCALAAHAVKQGYNVLVVHYEDSFRALKKRYTTLFTEPGLSDVYFLNARERKTGLVEIQNAISKVRPSFVVIDYFSRIPVLSTNKGSESRFQAKDVTELLKDIAVAHDCAMLVTDHITILQTKQSANPYRIWDYMVAEAKMYKMALVDTMLGLARDQYDGTKLYLTGMKFKREYSQMYQTFQVDWGKCVFKEF